MASKDTDLLERIDGSLLRLVALREQEANAREERERFEREQQAAAATWYRSQAAKLVSAMVAILTAVATAVGAGYYGVRMALPPQPAPVETSAEAPTELVEPEIPPPAPAPPTEMPDADGAVEGTDADRPLVHPATDEDGE